MTRRPRVRSVPAIVAALAACALLAALAVSVPRPAAARSSSKAIDPKLGIGNIDHLIFVVQENRSFDHYFGTFPGADGIPRTAGGGFKPCIPDPAASVCRRPYHDTNLFDQGGPHGVLGSNISIDGGKMDGFVRAVRQIGNGCTLNRTYYPCREARPGPNGAPDVMGFHTGREIPNYWAYAKHFVLQDHMFAPSDSWTLPSHLYLVSAWSATCSNPLNGMSCRSDLQFPGQNVASGKVWSPQDGLPRPYAWADITWLLNKDHVSWAYYVGPGTCVVAPCTGGKGAETAVVQNPLPGFRTVAVDHQLKNVQSNLNYFDAAANGTLPSVSWVMPTTNKGEHPPDYIGNGMAWVTRVVNAAMQGPDWLHTAIFLTWDDWGGFYDHVKPIRIDANGYGIRTPGILISPFAKAGTIDHQTLSFDAYLKLIEDRFLGGQRLNPRTDGWPDARPTVREGAKRLGDLRKEFDFSRPPIPPLILDPTP